MNELVTATLATASLLAAGAACDPGPASGKGPGTQPAGGAMVLQSTAFQDGGAIPSRHTCDGPDVSPPLQWSGVPPGAKSLVLIVDDPDAPDPAAPRMDWVHWVVYGLPPTSTGLPEGGTPLPEGARTGTNDFGKKAWGGPCPPIGRHRYFFRLHALDKVLPDLGTATRAAVEDAMKGHVLATAQCMGTYARSL